MDRTGQLDGALILYLHGFRSSPQSAKARVFAAWLTARGLGQAFVCPALSHVPEIAMAQAESVIRQHADQKITLVGSSLGGFYATCLAERHHLRAALINPAVPGYLDMDAWIGPWENLYSGEPFGFTADHVAQIARLDPPNLDPSRYLLLVETGDQTLNYGHAVERYRGCRQIVLPDGDHSFTRFADYLPELATFAGL